MEIVIKAVGWILAFFFYIFTVVLCGFMPEIMKKETTIGKIFHVIIIILGAVMFFLIVAKLK